MNLLNKNTAKLYISVTFLIVMTLLTHKANAQKEYTTISKNINPDASALYHDLSPQGDSLILKYESIFYKVTFLNSLDRRVYKFNPPVKEAKISLRDIIVGDYTVLVYGKDRIIVFHISRLLEIDKPEELLAVKEMPMVNLPMSNISQMTISLNEIPMNQIAMEDVGNFETSDINLAVNDHNLNVDQVNLITKVRDYNLSDLNREGMQSREEYRRNNLRPNGKPYY